ncbi:MAG: hypothetical protein JWL91_1098 [Sphingomonas bacterium]|nr:hypothetical protein [Sphingomonas bacterium]MDB5689222.1 hypothetical protein [Sphingomonas bacterium]
MGRLTDLLARPSAWLGLVGAALLCAALAWSMAMRLAPPAGAACPPLQRGGPAEQMRILDIGAAELELRGRICLSIDNVVSGAALGPQQGRLRAAQAELAAAREALRVAEQPPAPIPVWQSRYGVRPPTAEALAEQRARARARLNAAQTRLGAVTAALARGVGERRLALFINDERAPVPVRTVRGTSSPQTVTFTLLPDASAATDASGYWRALLGQKSEAGLVPVTLGIAEEGQTLPAATIRVTPARNGGMSRPIGLRVFHPEIRWLAGIGIALLLVGLAGVARSTGLLRDGRSRYARYSLGRVQMAWWFAVTIGGFVYIWLVTGQYLDVIGSATFVLLGIAGATAGAARVVDGPMTRTEPPSRGFLADIAGAERIELHRLQMIAWTIVLGGVYLWNVLANFALTDFDANLLALAGVVNGVYVGLKTQEAA